MLAFFSSLKTECELGKRGLSTVNHRVVSWPTWILRPNFKYLYFCASRCFWRSYGPPYTKAKISIHASPSKAWKVETIHVSTPALWYESLKNSMWFFFHWFSAFDSRLIVFCDVVSDHNPYHRESTIWFKRLTNSPNLKNIPLECTTISLMVQNKRWRLPLTANIFL